ncbi:chemotaxis protein CheB [Catalinimonas niigatensis]|uniref:chemotaxis protein CheB n=1 Tax=Catalinimonas niigatensis TaxID=1397264 RepID=UPI002665D13A|nr:chemotaxis protein CheB [Catalinimonas niigatensis]WPP48860.1 chemotaxis protein CheB [Catalinimonas niigatensis]
MESDFFVVGIGYSAGGLDPLRTFFEHIPPDSGLAFVVVQHLHREHLSRLKEILSYVTPIPIDYIRDSIKIQPDHIYVLQGNYYVKMWDSHLYLVERPKEHVINVAINTFFESLAEEKKEKAIGIILSGGGSDGATGSHDIYLQGGKVLVQTPASADFHFMPDSAIEADMPFAIETPDKLAEILIQVTKKINQS